MKYRVLLRYVGRSPLSWRLDVSSVSSDVATNRMDDYATNRRQHSESDFTP